MSDQAQLNVNSLKIESSEGETIEQLGVTNVEKTTSKAGYNYDKQISVNDIPLMSTIPNPTDAQQTEMLTVDANGQAVGAGVHMCNTESELEAFFADATTEICILGSTVTLTKASYNMNGAIKRIISESAVLNISNDVTFNISSQLIFISESLIFGKTANAGINNNSTANLYLNIRKLDSDVTGKPFSFSKNSTGAMSAAISNNECDITSNSANISYSTPYFVSNTVLQTTGVAVNFTQPKIYNTPTSPATGNVAFSQDLAKIGVVQKIYHNSGTEPTFTGVTNVVRTSGVYQTGQLNRIYAEWVATDRVEYRIENEASGWWHEWNIDEGKTTGKGYIDDAGNFTINLKLSYDNIDITQETFDLFSGVSGVCYVESVWDVVTKANTAGSDEVFADWRINNVIPYSDIRDTRFQLSFYDLIRAGSNGTYDDYDTNDGFLWVGQSFGEWTGASYPTYETYSINPFPEASALSFIANYNNSDGIREITIRGVISDKTKI